MRSSAAALVGQEVSYMTTEGDLITGIVDSVLYAGEVPTVIIGDTEIPLDAVAKVTTPGGAGGSAPEGAEGADGTAPGLDEADGPAPDGSIAA
jgi:flagellar basal-body rod modification protein FlgD